MADVELAGVIADDHRILAQAVFGDAAPDRALGGDLHRVGMDLQGGDGEPVEVGHPRVAIGELRARVAGQQGNHLGREIAPAHVIDRRRVDHEVGVAGAQQFEKVQPALRMGGCPFH